MDSEDDEEDVVGLDLFEIHDKRILTPEESRLDPKLQNLLEGFTLMHPYLNDLDPSWTAEDHMASIEKKMTECKLKLDIDYYGCTVKDGTQPVIHRPPIEDVVFYRNSNNVNQPIVGVLRGEAQLQFDHYPQWKECFASIYLQGNFIPKNILEGDMLQPMRQQLDLLSKFTGSEYKFVKDAVNLFEVGSADNSISPAYTWDARARSSKNWTITDNDNFNNFVKVYCFIQAKFEEMGITFTTIIKKKEWREGAKNLFGSRPDYFKIAVQKMQSRPLVQIMESARSE